jgi:lipoyl-dependent peroxiredoxin
LSGAVSDGESPGRERIGGLRATLESPNTQEESMTVEKQAHVEWSGDLESGEGTIDRVGSGAFGPLAVSWAARTGDEGSRTSPEELIAAAHASCFSMALSGALAKQGTPPERMSVSATVTFVPGTGITTSVIDVEGVVRGIDEAAFREAAEGAKEGCPVSKALKGNVELSVNARLAGS